MGWESNRHALKRRADAVFFFVVGVIEQDVGEVNCTAGDVDRLEGVDEGFVEPLDIVVVRRADDGGEGGLRLRKEVLGNLGSCRRPRWCLPVGGSGGRERSGERRDPAVVSVVAGGWRVNN